MDELCASPLIHAAILLLTLAVGTRIAPRFRVGFSNGREAPPYLEHSPDFDPDEDDDEDEGPTDEDDTDPYDDPVLSEHRKIYGDPYPQPSLN